MKPKSSTAESVIIDASTRFYQNMFDRRWATTTTIETFCFGVTVDSLSLLAKAFASSWLAPSVWTSF